MNAQLKNFSYIEEFITYYIRGLLNINFSLFPSNEWIEKTKQNNNLTGEADQIFLF